VIYHEGLPGHHLQLSLLAENSRLHPIRREQTELRTFALNRYLEGWAEYAAGLCEEIGVYANPRDRYGRMTAERFAAARMMADTGLNALGWPLDRQQPAYARTASCPSPRSRANCSAMQPMTPARHWYATPVTSTCENFAAPRTHASSTTRSSPAAPFRSGSSRPP
jgi:hypothetical protein